MKLIDFSKPLSPMGHDDCTQFEVSVTFCFVILSFYIITVEQLF